jgi:hypothetical protein
MRSVTLTTSASDEAARRLDEFADRAAPGVDGAIQNCQLLA